MSGRGDPAPTGFGIVVFDLNGGDAVFHFVDRERWTQILEVHSATDYKARGWKYSLQEMIGWLTADVSPEYERPEGAPDRRGKLLANLHTQTFVVEPAKGGIAGVLLGILTF